MFVSSEDWIGNGQERNGEGGRTYCNLQSIYPLVTYHNPILLSRNSYLQFTMFLSRVATPLARRAACCTIFNASGASITRRSMAATIQEALTAEDARQVSCYNEIDFSISEDAPVLDAVQKFSAYNIGCLVTTDADGTSRYCVNITCT